MTEAKNMHPADKTNGSKGCINLSAGESLPAGAKAYQFKADSDEAVLEKCNGKSYSGKTWEDPCNVAGKTIGNTTIYTVAGEINDAKVTSGNVVFYLLEPLQE